MIEGKGLGGVKVRETIVLERNVTYLPSEKMAAGGLPQPKYSINKKKQTNDIQFEDGAHER